MVADEPPIPEELMAEPSHQMIKTPSGEELVVLPRVDYDRLLTLAAEAEEDLADVSAYDAAMADLAAERGAAIAGRTFRPALEIQEPLGGGETMARDVPGGARGEGRRRSRLSLGSRNEAPERRRFDDRAAGGGARYPSRLD